MWLSILLHSPLFPGQRLDHSLNIRVPAFGFRPFGLRAFQSADTLLLDQYLAVLAVLAVSSTVLAVSSTVLAANKDFV